MNECHANRNSDLGSKTRCGGLCILRFCSLAPAARTVLVSYYCSSLVEFVIVRCKPFDLQWEFTTVFIIGVYIPLSTNIKEVLSELFEASSKLQLTNGLFIVVGDFNHTNLKSLLPKFHQCVD